MSNEAPTDALRLDEAQRTAIEHAAMDANADVWRHCRLAMVADGEIVGYPCFSRADMAELARLYEAAPASPLPGGGCLGAERLSAAITRLTQVAAGDEIQAAYADFTFPGHTFRADVRAVLSALPAAPTGDA